MALSGWTGAAWQQYADEVWSRRVGNVTGQHVGRLRRVYERFHSVYPTYTGLYWSHFQAALDWSDAEMWLEGAVQNEWSIAEMRHERWQAMGGAESEQPREEDLVAAELDEDYTPLASNQLGEVHAPESVEGIEFDGGGNADSESAAGLDDGVPFDADGAAESGETAQPVRPFERLADLPADVSEAFEAYKLAILHHKLDGWRDISCLDLIGSLEALKQLALRRRRPNRTALSSIGRSPPCTCRKPIDCRIFGRVESSSASCPPGRKTLYWLAWRSPAGSR